MSEAALRNYVRTGLGRAGVLTTHHEDALQAGVPDLSYSGGGVNGWVELKYAEAWPARARTPLRLPHYTAEQRHFLLTRGRAGGRCWLLLRVGREHLLFDHERAQHVGEMERLLLVACAKLHHGGGRLEFELLTRLLTR